MSYSLKHTTVVTVQHTDFEDLIFEILGRPYSAVVGFYSPSNGELIEVDLDFMDEEEEIGQEEFAAWMSLPLPEDLRKNSMEWYHIANESPSVLFMVQKLRDAGVQMPEKFSMLFSW